MQAMAAHNTGGIVIVQVERVVASGSLPAQARPHTWGNRGQGEPLSPHPAST